MSLYVGKRGIARNLPNLSKAKQNTILRYKDCKGYKVEPLHRRSPADYLGGALCRKKERKKTKKNTYPQRRCPKIRPSVSHPPSAPPCPEPSRPGGGRPGANPGIGLRVTAHLAGPVLRKLVEPEAAIWPLAPKTKRLFVGFPCLVVIFGGRGESQNGYTID